MLESGAHLEDKRYAVAVHTRRVADPASWAGPVGQAAARVAAANGLEVVPGRMVWELRPQVRSDKGDAVRRVLEESGARRLVVAGDDLGDLPAFAVAAEVGGGLRVAVRSDEAPPELLDAAALVGTGQKGVRELLGAPLLNAGHRCAPAVASVAAVRFESSVTSGLPGSPGPASRVASGSLSTSAPPSTTTRRRPARRPAVAAGRRAGPAGQTSSGPSSSQRRRHRRLPAAGQGQVGAPRGAADAAQVEFAAVPLPDLRPDPETGDGWVRFGQTAGGLLSIGMPYRAGPDGSPRLAAPAAWTTLALTIHADGTSSQALAGASPFPRHWVYDHDGRLIATSGVVDFTGWQADAWDPFTPWGGRDAAVRATAVETALERELSRIMLDSAPHWLRLRKGATLVTQGDPGHELYLLFDGLLAVEIDGVTVTELGPGRWWCELALLDGAAAPHPAGRHPLPGRGRARRPDDGRPGRAARTRGWPGRRRRGPGRDRLPWSAGAATRPGPASA